MPAAVAVGHSGDAAGELGTLKLGALSKRALIDGATDAQLEAAQDDEDDPKAALIALIIGLQAGPLRAELQALKLGGLSSRAVAAGVDPALLEEAQDDGDDPKTAIIDLIVQQTALTPSVSASAAAGTLVGQRTPAPSDPQRHSAMVATATRVVMRANPLHDSVRNDPAPPEQQTPLVLYWDASLACDGSACACSNSIDSVCFCNSNQTRQRAGLGNARDCLVYVFAIGFTAATFGCGSIVSLPLLAFYEGRKRSALQRQLGQEPDPFNTYCYLLTILPCFLLVFVPKAQEARVINTAWERNGRQPLVMPIAPVDAWAQPVATLHGPRLPRSPLDQSVKLRVAVGLVMGFVGVGSLLVCASSEWSPCTSVALRSSQELLVHTCVAQRC